ncbi:MAG: hypothetical protein ACYCWW_20215 [Deltaproteobacteria bacterium]
MTRTAAQDERHSRQILVPEIGARGQARLLSAQVEVRLSGAASVAGRALSGYLEAAGVELAPGARVRVASPELADRSDRFVLGASAAAWASLEGGPCGLCLAEAVSLAQAPQAELAGAASFAAGAALAAQLLLALAGEHEPSAGGVSLAPVAGALTLPAGCRHG